MKIKTYRHIRTTLLTAAITAVATAATAQGTDKWTLYPSYANITEIQPAGKNTFVLASGAIFSYSTADGSITTYDKTNSLSDTQATHIAWSQEARRLAITYENSNIDLLSADGTTVNVPELYMDGSTLDKTINHIYIDGRDAYISTGYGILKLDMAEGSINENYVLGFPVNYCYTADGCIYAASQQKGIYRGDMRDNLLDPSNWTRTGNYTARNENKTNVQDPSTGYWWTKTDDGKLTYYTIDDDGNRTYMTEGAAPDGPASNNFYRIYLHDSTLYGVSGLWNQDLDAGRKGEVHVWDGQSWSEFEQPTQEEIGHAYVDPLCIDFDPTHEGHVMVGAKSGMYEFQDGQFVKHYNYNNSGLQSPFNNTYNYTIVSSMKYDTEGNLWLLNPLVDNSLKKFSKDGEWTTFEHQELSGAGNYNQISLFISKTNGLMWFVNSYNNNAYLYSYNANEDLLNYYGPEFTNQNGTIVDPLKAYCTTEDRNGNIWLGTSQGPLYITPENIRNGTNIFTQYVVPRDDGSNLGDYLLEGVNIRAIAVDGGNSKWFGTDGNGVFLISSDNNTQIQHFTTENSPLPSNVVQDIAIDGTSGLVYFATDNGLCSYQSDTTEPSAEMKKDNVYAHPNPVRPDYTGPITIVGLTYDADVKITTSNGTLVAEGRSTGGTFQWDGCDSGGKRVASGVYMVQTATSSGDKGTVCKIAIVN